MARKIELDNLDNLIERYLAGETIKELARECGVNTKIVWNRIKEAGVPIRGRRLPVPDDLIARYLSGVSEKQLATDTGLSRSVIRRRLIEAGIQPRDGSASMKLRWASSTLAERANMVRAAHKAVLGSTQTVDQLQRRAVGKERTAAHATPAEGALARSLRRRGFSVTQQKAVHIYNVDIAVHEPTIAVEIFGGNFHATGRHGARFFKRTKYLLDHGWSVVIIWVDGRRYPLSVVACGDYLLTLANELRANPSPVGQYRVILGNAETAPVAEMYFNTPSAIERLCATNESTG